MACGLRPWISTDFHTIRPALGARMPVIRLSSVVLPDPFGPKIPTISPLAMENVTSDTAMSPPKRLVNSMTSSTAPARQRADDALRQDQDGENQHQAVENGSRLAGKVDHVRKSGEHEGTGNRADDRGPAAQQDHRNDIQRLIDAEITRLDIAGIKGVETAGYRSERIRQGER